jgi:hypothetical protein
MDTVVVTITGGLTESECNALIDVKIAEINLPTKTSDLENDSNFITSSDIPAIPTKTSDLTNDSNFAVDASYVHTDNNYSTAEKNKVAAATPLVNQIFSGELNLSTNFEVYYNQYTSNVALTPTISATPIVGAAVRLVINAGASASLVATNLGTIRAGSDTYTVSKLNELIVYNLPEGLSYQIKVLN